ncbi:Uncharacterized protein FWK35_00024001 [Aphis craccivora]|uniref:SAP domain-containing protein n=1 Tax=Aphis craccivora TaxID=307492 RepID=A0A6G0WA83_APHCR|nr:Uncharacterized protein FWK35_00024001 [Aphis craccivora]
MEIEIFKSNKGNIKIAFEGFLYTKKKTCENHIQWKCSKTLSLKCFANFTSSLELVGPNLWSKLNRDHSNKRKLPGQIVSETVINQPKEVLYQLPCENLIKRTLRNQRTGNHPNDGNCDDLKTLKVEVLTRYATAASTKYRHRSDRSATLSTASTDVDDTILSTLPPTPQRLGGTGRQVAPNEYRPPAIALSCVKCLLSNSTGEPRSPTTALPSSSRQIGSPQRNHLKKEVNVKLWTAELRGECTSSGLSISGSKSDVIIRLEEFIRKSGQDPTNVRFNPVQSASNTQTDGTGEQPYATSTMVGTDASWVAGQPPMANTACPSAWQLTSGGGSGHGKA